MKRVGELKNKRTCDFTSHRHFGPYDVYYDTESVRVYVKLPDGYGIAEIDRKTWRQLLKRNGPVMSSVLALVLHGKAYSIHSRPADIQKTHDAWEHWRSKNSMSEEEVKRRCH